MGGGHIPGVIPLAVEDVFQTIKNVINVFLFTCLVIKPLVFLTDAFILFQVSKERVPSQGVLHGDLQ